MSNGSSAPFFATNGFPVAPSGPPSSNGNYSNNNNNSINDAPSSRPSDARRKVLNEELTVPLVSNFFPIERYYDAADKVFDSFQSIFAVIQDDFKKGNWRKVDASLDDAYVYGKRYCLFCLDGIPTHNYYASTKYRRERQQHHLNVQQVLQQLEQVVEYMDSVEQQKSELMRQEQALLLREKERRQQEKLLEWQHRIQQQQQKQQQQSTANTSLSSQDVQMSALNKLKLLSQQGTTTDNTVGTASQQQQQRIRVDPSGQEPLPDAPGLTGTSRYRFLDDDSEDDGDNNHNALPPPLLPPKDFIQPPPPSYDMVVGQGQSSRLFLGPASTPNKDVSTEPSQRRPAKKQQQQQLRLLQEQYKREYLLYQQRGLIQVSGINTYQGRVDASTNGCTVISALVAAAHLQSKGSISNETICRIIDSQCGPILRTIRSKLGLGSHALIIPSDVHDHLVDAKILSQDTFEGVAGGNIMDPDHLQAFVELLDCGESGKKTYNKAAATLFFREHVISIVKNVSYSNNHGATTPKVTFDLIDSLPGLSNNNSSSLLATRTHCVSRDSLLVLLKWYASRKFSSDNCAYCDRTPWDDAMADFDPRVFQGFVWVLRDKQ